MNVNVLHTYIYIYIKYYFISISILIFLTAINARLFANIRCQELFSAYSQYNLAYVEARPIVKQEKDFRNVHQWVDAMSAIVTPCFCRFAFIDRALTKFTSVIDSINIVNFDGEDRLFCRYLGYLFTCSHSYVIYVITLRIYNECLRDAFIFS